MSNDLFHPHNKSKLQLCSLIVECFRGENCSPWFVEGHWRLVKGAYRVVRARDTCTGDRGGRRRYGHTLALRAHGKGGGRSHVHVHLWRKLQCSKLSYFFLQSSVFLSQILTTMPQVLTINLCLLQLGPALFKPLLRPSKLSITYSSLKIVFQELTPM